MTPSLVVQRPARARQLMLLFHGVGATAQHLAPLGQQLAAVHADAFIVSVAAPQRADARTGYQWFSIRRLTDERRLQRAQDALPGFLAAVSEWQGVAGLAAAADTTLVGFSQGGMMVLQSLQQRPLPARRFVCIAGRLISAPPADLAGVPVHLLHGAADPTIAAQHSTRAAEQLGSAGAAVTLDLVPNVGHELEPVVIHLLLGRLREPA